MENEYESYDCLGCSNTGVIKAQMPQHRFEYDLTGINSEKTSKNIINNNKTIHKSLKQTNHEIKV